SIGRAPSALSIVSTTSARPRGPFVAVPAKMTSSILPPRSVFAPCSPMTQARASTTLDLPDPFGPTTQVTPGSKAKVVGWAKDLNPLSVRLFRYTAVPSSTRRNSFEYGTRPPGLSPCLTTVRSLSRGCPAAGCSLIGFAPPPRRKDAHDRVHDRRAADPGHDRRPGCRRLHRDDPRAQRDRGRHPRQPRAQ